MGNTEGNTENNDLIRMDVLVLSIYFHDMGMIVTKKEFENRDHSDLLSIRKRYMRDKLVKIIKRR